MGVEKNSPTQTGRTPRGETPPLRARDIEQVIDPGVDVGFAERESATGLDALRGRVKEAPHERSRSQVWIGVLILVLLGVCVILGVQFF